MVTKSLDDIVLEADIKERIRPLFEQATASGTVSFEHDWQWGAYCDLLNAASDFIERTRQGVSLYINPPFNAGWPIEIDWHIDSAHQLCEEFATGCFVDAVKKLKTYSSHRSAFFKKVFYGIGISPIFLELYAINDQDNNDSVHTMVKVHRPTIKTYIEDVLHYSAYFNEFILQREGEACINLGWYSLITDGSTTYEIYKEHISRLKRLIDPLKEIRERLLSNRLGTEAEIDDLLFSLVVYEYDKSNIRHLTPLGHVSGAKPGQASWSYISAEIISKNLEINIPDYRSFERIGEGSGRIAYKAWDETDRCDVAIKVAKNTDSLNSSNRKGWEERYGKDGLAEREAQAARDLTHKNIARYFSRGRLPDGRPYIIEEYVDGITLEEHIAGGANIDELEGFVSIAAAAPEILMQVLEGLAYLHRRGFVHRDIKPSNIIIPRNFWSDADSQVGNTEVRITDLELVKKILSGDSQRESHGSRIYAAPEALQTGTITQLYDVFSSGIVMYETFVREHPFLEHTEEEVSFLERIGNIRGISPKKIAYAKEDYNQIIKNICDPNYHSALEKKIMESNWIPSQYKPIIIGCLKYDPAERYKNAGEVLYALEEQANFIEGKRMLQKVGCFAVIGASLALCTGLCLGTAWYVHDFLTDSAIIETEK